MDFKKLAEISLIISSINNIRRSRYPQSMLNLIDSKFDELEDMLVDELTVDLTNESVFMAAVNEMASKLRERLGTEESLSLSDEIDKFTKMAFKLDKTLDESDSKNAPPPEAPVAEDPVAEDPVSAEESTTEMPAPSVWGNIEKLEEILTCADLKARREKILAYVEKLDLDPKVLDIKLFVENIDQSKIDSVENDVEIPSEYWQNKKTEQPKMERPSFRRKIRNI